MDKQEKEPISASEIGRYLYCNYQWYYEKRYGMSQLRTMQRAYLKEAGVSQPDNSPKARGRLYHSRFRGVMARRRLYIIVRAVAFVFILILLILFGQYII